MNILLLTQYYWPENSRVTDIAESLVDKGHKVTVLTGLPNYPEGYIYNGYKKKENWVQEHNRVRILRAKLIERRHDAIHRFLNYYSFPFFASKIAKKMTEDFDVVLIMEESPIMLAYPGIKYAVKHNKPLVMYEMDLWPESLLAGGIKRNSIIYKHFKKISSKIYSKMNKILVSTKEHINYIKSLPNCSHLDIDYLPQYADSIFEQSKLISERNETIDLMFAGNIGKAQSVDTIIRAASLLKEDKRFKFHIVGSGSEFIKVQNLAKKLDADNVVFYGQKSLDQMPLYYKFADGMLVTLEDKTYANMTIPGKIQTYMATGKPIVAAINGSTSNFIKENNIGYVCDAQDSSGLAEIIKKLDVEELKVIGKKAKNVYFNKYSKECFFNKLAEVLNNIILKND